MKKFTILLITVVAFFNTINAQIPNSGFENWSGYGNGLLPNGWWCANDSVNSSETYFPITRSTEHYPTDVGNYSIRIANNPSLLPGWSAMGIAWTGGWSGNDSPAFPVIGHPISLCGYCKFLPQNDSMRIYMCLYHDGVEVAQAKLVDTVTVSVWTPFVIPIPDYADADSARIMISTFDADSFIIHGNSVLYVDNLSFDTLVTSVSETQNTNKSLFICPNPASDFVTIGVDGMSGESIICNVYNMLGILIKTEILENNRQFINVNGLYNGIYLVVIKSKEWSETQKMIIQR